MTSKLKAGSRARRDADQMLLRGASVDAVHRETGVPERTLRRRRKELLGAKRFTGPRRVPSLATAPVVPPPALAAPPPAKRTRDELVDDLESARSDAEHAAAADALFAADDPAYALARATGSSVLDSLMESRSSDVIFLLRDAGDLAAVIVAVTEDPRTGHVCPEGETWPSNDEMRAAARERAIALAQAVLEQVREAKP